MGDYWQTIKGGLVETAEKAPGGWTPQDVFMQLVRGEATLHLVIVDKYYKGFLISKTIGTNGSKGLLIWIMHGDGSGNLMVDNMDQIRDWARNIGAKRIQMQSPRKGWERVAKKLGFRVTQIVYEQDV